MYTFDAFHESSVGQSRIVCRQDGVEVSRLEYDDATGMVTLPERTDPIETTLDEHMRWVSALESWFGQLRRFYSIRQGVLSLFELEWHRQTTVTPAVSVSVELGGSLFGGTWEEGGNLTFPPRSGFVMNPTDLEFFILKYREFGEAVQAVEELIAA